MWPFGLLRAVEGCCRRARIGYRDKGMSHVNFHPGAETRYRLNPSTNRLRAPWRSSSVVEQGTHKPLPLNAVVHSAEPERVGAQLCPQSSSALGRRSVPYSSWVERIGCTARPLADKRHPIQGGRTSSLIGLAVTTPRGTRPRALLRTETSAIVVVVGRRAVLELRLSSCRIDKHHLRCTLTRWRTRCSDGSTSSPSVGDFSWPLAPVRPA